MTREVPSQALVDPALRAEIAPARLLTSPEEAVRRTREYLVGALLLMEPASMAELARRAASHAGR
ncbi:hypothetical protein ACFU51_15020 [Streptomyces sp. NPDC057430]|uniref:hypothetical protein n=1 Tax=Streptomyces sp. NPDC057430 TaxID=3346131 RepID=UPI003675F98C